MGHWRPELLPMRGGPFLETLYGGCRETRSLCSDLCVQILINLVPELWNRMYCYLHPSRQGDDFSRDFNAVIQILVKTQELSMDIFYDFGHFFAIFLRRQSVRPVPTSASLNLLRLPESGIRDFGCPFHNPSRTMVPWSVLCYYAR